MVNASEQSSSLSEVIGWQDRIDIVKKSRTNTKHLAKPRAIRRASIGGKWTSEEDEELRSIVDSHGAKNWKNVAKLLGSTGTDVQCLHRWNKVLKPGLHKGSWSPEEDEVVRQMVRQNIGEVKWSAIAAKLPGRIGKQCRERWFNHLDPVINRGEWNYDEDRVLYEAQRHFGNRWCEISKMLPGRTENAVKNRWNSSTMKKWLAENKLAPGTGQPLEDMTVDGGLERAVKSFNKCLQDAGVNGVDASRLLMTEKDLPSGDNGQHDKSTDKRKPKRRRKTDISKTELMSFEPVGLKANSLTNLPPHLRPPGISIRNREDDGTNKVLDLLTLVKGLSSPKDVNGDISSQETSSKRRKLGGCASSGKNSFQISTRSRKAKGSDPGQKSPTSRAFARIDDILFENGLADKADAAEYTEDGDLSIETREKNEAVEKGILDQDSNVPILLLPFFQHLNGKAKRNIIRQLIEKFQRTYTTPRNALLLPTPKLDHTLLSNLTSSDLDLDTALKVSPHNLIPKCSPTNGTSVYFGSSLDFLTSPRTQSSLLAEESDAYDRKDVPIEEGSYDNREEHDMSSHGLFSDYDESIVETVVLLVSQIILNLDTSEDVIKMLAQESFPQIFTSN